VQKIVQLNAFKRKSAVVSTEVSGVENIGQWHSVQQIKPALLAFGRTLIYSYLLTYLKMKAWTAFWIQDETVQCYSFWRIVLCKVLYIALSQ